MSVFPRFVVWAAGVSHLEKSIWPQKASITHLFINIAYWMHSMFPLPSSRELIIIRCYYYFCSDWVFHFRKRSVWRLCENSLCNFSKVRDYGIRSVSAIQRLLTWCVPRRFRKSFLWNGPWEISRAAIRPVLNWAVWFWILYNFIQWYIIKNDNVMFKFIWSNVHFRHNIVIMDCFSPRLTQWCFIPEWFSVFERI